MTPSADKLLFSHPVSVAERETELSQSLDANQPQRDSMAALYGLHAIDQLRGEVILTPGGGGRWLLEGQFSAVYKPICSVTLAPFRQKMSDHFVRHYETEAFEETDSDTETEFELPEDDSLDPDPIIDGIIDIADALAEEFAVRLDPYPRAPGADFSAEISENGVEIAEKASPFAKLAILKDKKQ